MVYLQLFVKVLLSCTPQLLSYALKQPSPDFPPLDRATQRPPVPMPSEARVVYYKKELLRSQDESVPYSDRLCIIHALTKEAALSVGKDVKEFCDAGGVQVLVDIALKDWPVNGKLAASTAATDVVKVVKHPDGSSSIESHSKGVPRSLRRMAIVMLAMMTKQK